MLVFFVTLCLYLVTLFPSVAPYRDTGEMVSVAHTLGIAHPPGYPLYALVSKVALLVFPWGNAGYRLNVLSALAGAATVAVMYRLVRELLEEQGIGGRRVAAVVPVLAALLLATSYLQWYLSLVSEMYTINTLFAAVLLYGMYRLLKEPSGGGFFLWYLMSFLFGLGLGNRTDLLLLAPALLWVLLSKRKELSGARAAGIAASFFIGFSVFFYLPVRSSAFPLLDWNHPATLDRLWGTLTRKTHGGTLDLISENYAAGENFGATMRFYFSHLFSGFAFAGLPLGVLGLYSLWRRQRSFAVATFVAWLCTAPVFIYLANIPPNPHALVILEAHFLLPNLFFFFWIVEGMTFAARRWGKNAAVPALALGALVLAGINGYTHFGELDKRANYVAYDYSKNVLRSLPPGAVVVMKKDVQLFTLWNRQIVEGERTDLAVISQGLASSAWYRDGMAKRAPGVYIGPLKDEQDWRSLLEFNRGKEVYVSADAEYRRPAGFGEEPAGIVSRITVAPGTGRGGALLDELYSYRGDFRYNAYREFFTPDLIDDYARARMSLGRSLYERGSQEQARRNFTAALAMQPLFPMAWNYIGFTYFQEGSFDRARLNYNAAVRQYQEYFALAEKYNAQRSSLDGIRRDWSDALVSAGVCAEKLGKTDESLAAYEQALAVDPGQAKAYFNRAVIFWKKQEWGRVITDLEAALRIDPNNKEAAFYLTQARARQGR